MGMAYLEQQEGEGVNKSEQTIQSEIRIALSEYGCVFRTNAGRAWAGTIVYDVQRKQNILINLRPVNLLAPGFSDLLYVGPSRVGFIECKRPGEKPRPDQVNFLDRMQSYGHIAGVARSVEDAIKLIGRKTNG
jgi:hypothetical protein